MVRSSMTWSSVRPWQLLKVCGICQLEWELVTLDSPIGTMRLGLEGDMREAEDLRLFTSS